MPTPTQIVRTEMLNGRVLSNIALTRRLFSLRIAVDLLPFEAGQFVRLELVIDGAKVARPYSLVNTPGDPVAEVFFNTVPGGQLSNALAVLRENDTVAVSQPATGFFVLDGTPVARDLWLLATGTGLGPYLSILRTPQLWERFENVVLVHGVSMREELVYQDVINLVQLKYPGRFNYLSCVSRAANPAGLTGRITEGIKCGELERRAGMSITASQSSVMLCGNHSMINDMKVLLAARDMRRHLRHKPGHILTEQYF
jgi:ferredoxin/flavodoxin---NADP+ reductase